MNEFPQDLVNYWIENKEIIKHGVSILTVHESKIISLIDSYTVYQGLLAIIGVVGLGVVSFIAKQFHNIAKKNEKIEAIPGKIAEQMLVQNKTHTEEMKMMREMFEKMGHDQSKRFDQMENARHNQEEAHSKRFEIILSEQKIVRDHLKLLQEQSVNNKSIKF
jgi:hypothetical protein